MYNTSASDLDRIAGDLNKLANTYTSNAQQLDQQVASLDGVTSQVVNSGPEKWTGQASTAFLGAWSERKARMQQAAQLLDESAQHLKQLAQTIDNQLPTIRAQQTAPLKNPTAPPPPSLTAINAETQAQNAIAMALGTLNSQLEELAAGIKDCPQAKQQAKQGGNEPNNVKNDINKAKGKGQSGDGNGGNSGTKGKNGTEGNSGTGGGTGLGLRYDPSEKHGNQVRSDSKGRQVSTAPQNGQAALDNSVQISPNSPRRLGVDPKTGEVVVFDETHPGQNIFHGHVRSWNSLPDNWKNTLIKAGKVDKKGRPIAKD